MESKHTPGPWSVHRYDLDTDNGIKVTTADIGRRVIAEVQNPDNAALIAAAPDMYEAIATAMEILTDSWGDEQLAAGDDQAYNVLSAALAKAEGRA